MKKVSKSWDKKPNRYLQSPEKAAVEETAALGHERYNWHTFGGKTGVKLHYKGAHHTTLKAGMRYGMRHSSDGKSIHLITEHNGKNIIHKITNDHAERLAERSKPLRKGTKIKDPHSGPSSVKVAKVVKKPAAEERPAPAVKPKKTNKAHPIDHPAETKHTPLPKNHLDHIKTPEDAIHHVKTFLAEHGHKITGEVDHTKSYVSYHHQPLSHSIHTNDTKHGAKKAHEQLAEHLHANGWLKDKHGSRYHHPTNRGISIMPSPSTMGSSRIHVSGDHRTEHPNDHKHPHHGMDNATKVRNYITKTHGGENLRSWRHSNPYDDRQTLDHVMHKGQAKKLEEHLKAHGWTSKYPHSYQHPTHHAVSIDVRHNQNPKKKSHIAIHGPKKAKRSNLPLYD